MRISEKDGPLEDPCYRTLARKLMIGAEGGIITNDELAYFVAIAWVAHLSFEAKHPELPKAPGITLETLHEALTGVPCSHQ